MGGTAETRRRFFWCKSRWCAGDCAGELDCSGGVDGGSEPGEELEFRVMPDARRVLSEASVEVVWSRMYSMTSQV